MILNYSAVWILGLVVLYIQWDYRNIGALGLISTISMRANSRGWRTYGLFNTQRRALRIIIIDVLCDRDIFACLPTGYGKSFCLRWAFDELSRKDRKSIVLVVLYASVCTGVCIDVHVRFVKNKNPSPVCVCG